MLFVVTTEWEPASTMDVGQRTADWLAKGPPAGAKILGHYILLGQCKSIMLVEASDEKAILNIHMPFTDIAECEWAPAMPVADLLKAVGM
jgi:hypothetical protein